uniref:Mab-21-like nucleotidyltransferase domain-containing protein n=3 Tax=Clytia hemisphaerica TaxID=252671 RepID=A0A7M5URV6_9CNID
MIRGKLVVLFQITLQFLHLRKDSSIESSLEDVRQIQDREETLKNLLSSSTMEIIKNSNRVRNHFNESILTGSLNQGNFIASMFKANLKYTKHLINRDIDIDLMTILNYEIDNPVKCLHDIKGKPGHLQVLTSCLPVKKTWHNSFILKHKYLRSSHIKMQFLNQSNPTKYIIHRRSELFFRYHFKKHRKKCKEFELRLFAEKTKSTVKVFWQLYVDEEPYLSFEVDVAVMFRIFHRPRVIIDFLKRTQYNLTKEISEYIYVLAKTSHEEKNNINTTEWTYSFSHIENFILNSFSDAKKLVYVIFKSIFNKSLK